MGVSVDLDYFTVTVPVGQVLAALNVLPGTWARAPLAPSSRSIRRYRGPIRSAPLPRMPLGYYLYRAADIGTNIWTTWATFNFMGTNPSIGFVPPLPSAPTPSGSRKASTAPSRTTSSWY
jgi:hypothetical protein